MNFKGLGQTQPARARLQFPFQIHQDGLGLSGWRAHRDVHRFPNSGSDFGFQRGKWETGATGPVKRRYWPCPRQTEASHSSPAPAVCSRPAARNRGPIREARPARGAAERAMSGGDTRRPSTVFNAAVTSCPSSVSARCSGCSWCSVMSAPRGNGLPGSSLSVECTSVPGSWSTTTSLASSR